MMSFTQAIGYLNLAVQHGLLQGTPDTEDVSWTFTQREAEFITAGDATYLETGETLTKNIYDFAEMVSSDGAMAAMLLQRIKAAGISTKLPDKWWEADKIGWENGTYTGETPYLKPEQPVLSI